MFFFPLFWGSSLQRVWQTEGGADGWWASFWKQILQTKEFTGPCNKEAFQQRVFGITLVRPMYGCQVLNLLLFGEVSPFSCWAETDASTWCTQLPLEDLGWRVQRKPAINRNRPSYKVHNKFCWFSVERGFSIFLVQSIGYFPRSKWVLCLFLPSSSRQVVLDCMLLEGWVCFKALRFMCLYGNSCDSAARVKVAPISAFEPDVFPSCSGIVWSVVQRLVEV